MPVETRQLYTKYRLAPRRRKKRTRVRWVLASIGVAMLGWIVWQSGQVQSLFVKLRRPGPPAQGGTQTNLAVRSARPVASTLPSPPTTGSGVGASPRPFRARAIQDVLEAQIALERRGISSGPIDGVLGSQTRAALRAFQLRERLPASGELDPATRYRLILEEPPYAVYTVTAEDVEGLTAVPKTWLGKSELDRLSFESVLELAAEKFHCHPNLLRRLNPSADWASLAAGATLQVPNAYLPVPRTKAAFVRILLSGRTLQVFDTGTNLLAQFPCSIARSVIKRPVGELLVVKAAEDPEYTFDPEIFPESLEGRQLGRKLRIPPGPNNPVGIAWIGLDRPGYGIHGTPHPEAVGRTESHGCFRLANWNAEYLAKLVWPGMPVHVEP